MSAAPTVEIVNGRLIDPGNNIDESTNIYVADGRILAIGDKPLGFEAMHSIEATEQIVCPGFIDLSARLREPGQEHKATIASETAAAAKSGITTLCCPPDTDPVIDNPAVVELIRHRSKQSGKAMVLPIGALTQGLSGEAISEMATLKEAGCIAVSNALAPLKNTLVGRHALEYAASFGLTVLLRPEDHHLADNGCAHEGPVANRIGLAGIPSAAEYVAVSRDIALAELTGARVHFCGISTAKSVKMVAQAQLEGLAVSADVAAHQLHLTDLDIDPFNSQCHVIPPLRTYEDREALREGVANGSITSICSDHQPHEADAKLAPFPLTEPGISGLETLLPLTLKLVEDGVISLTDAIAKLTSGPADILELSSGRLAIGDQADIAIFDPEAYWKLDPKSLVSRGKNSPFNNWYFSGIVTHTLFQGRIVYSDKP